MSAFPMHFTKQINNMLAAGRKTANTSSKKWKVCSRFEASKLASSSGWTFASTLSSSGSRTTRSSYSFDNPITSKKKRHASHADAEPSPKRPKEVVLVVDNNEDNSNDTITAARKKPACTRLLMEMEMLKSVMERHITCKKCDSEVFVSFPTVCIASGCRIQCSNKMCDFIDIETPVSADVPLGPNDGSPLIERSTDYAANIL